MATKTEVEQGQDFAAKLATKILAVMDDVKSVAKDGKNAFHNYKYASDAAIITEVRVAMIKHRLIALPDQVSCERSLGTKGKKVEAELDLTTLKVAYTIIDAETGYSTTIHVHGQGQDSGDKGAYKAATGAEKYFFLKAFMIPTDDDPEKDSPAEARRDTPAPKPATPPAKPAAAAPPADDEEKQVKARELIEAIKEMTSFAALEKFGKELKPITDTFSPALKDQVVKAYLTEKKRFQKLEK